MLEIIFKSTCGKCGRVHEDKFPISTYGPIPHPPIPYNWHRYDNGFICDDHVVGIMDKVSTKDGDK